MFNTSIPRWRAKSNRPRSMFGIISTDSDGSRWLVKSVDPEKHRLRIYGGAWAVDAEQLDELRADGGAGVRLELPDGEVLEAEIAAFDKHGIPFEFGDCGEQVALPERYWAPGGAECSASEQTVGRSRDESAAKPAAPSPSQACLFDMGAATTTRCTSAPSRAYRDTRPLRETPCRRALK